MKNCFWLLFVKDAAILAEPVQIFSLSYLHFKYLILTVMSHL